MVRGERRSAVSSFRGREHVDDAALDHLLGLGGIGRHVRRHGVRLTRVGALGFSAMKHGYLAFDADGALLVPFRTWRNTNTERAAAD